MNDMQIIVLIIFGGIVILLISIFYKSYKDMQNPEKRKEYEKSMRKIKIEQNRTKLTPIKCPKCYSSQIQLVPRKWSVMTGIFTNKIDRVCVNCKHKF